MESGRADEATSRLGNAGFRGRSVGFVGLLGTFCCPVATDPGEDGGGEPDERARVGEAGGDASASLHSLVEPPDAVGVQRRRDGPQGRGGP